MLRSRSHRKQVSLQVKQVTNPHRWKEELLLFPKKIHLHPQPGTSKDPTDKPAVDPTQDPTQAPAQDREEETPPDLTEYVQGYQQAGKEWLDTVLDHKEQANKALFNKLLKLGDPHIPKFTNADRETVLKCIKDMTGRFLSEDEFTIYEELEEAEIQKPQVRLKGNAKEALKDYYDAVYTLCEA